jgi:hypothetical protein
MGEQTRTSTTDDRGSTAQVAREQSQQVAGRARDATSNVAREASRQLRNRADHETSRAGSALAQAGGQLQALADGRVDEAGVFGEYAQQAAQSVNRWADSVQDRGLDGMLDDLRSVARRRPGAFLLGALAAGVVAGRFGRNLREETSSPATSSPASSASTTSPPTTPPPTTSPPTTPPPRSGRMS